MKKFFTLVFMCSMMFLGYAQESGTFDSSFGSEGISRFTPSANSHDFLEKVLIQPDGKILTTGRSRYDGINYDIYVSRHNTDGTLDASFGTNGIKHCQATQHIYINAARDMALGDNGLMYIAGYTYDYTNNESFVLCLDENGFEYPYFGDNGFAVSEYGGEIVYEAIDVDSYGRPIVAGYLNDTVLVRRYNTVGLLDPSFGTEGTAQVNVPNAEFSFGYDIVVLEDNKILVSGVKVDFETKMLKSFVMRLKSNGTLDNTFGNNGVVDLQVGPYAEYALALDVDANGNYLVAGHSEMPNNSETLPKYEAFVGRILADGTIDNAFGINGYTKFEMFEGQVATNNSEAVVAAHDGQIFGTVYSFDHDTQDSRAYVYNLNENGQLNEEFAGIGILPITLQPGDVEVRTAAINLQNDGKLLVGGLFFTNEGYASDIFVSRIHTDVAPIDPNDPAEPAAIDLTTEAIDAYSIKAIVTPNTHVVEYHVGIASKAMYDQTGEEALVEAIQADNRPFTGAEEIVFDGLTPETEYVVIATGKNAVDVWCVTTTTVTTPEGIGYAEIEEGKFNIYPNPATSVVYVESSNSNNAQVSIIDLTGRCVKQVETTDNITAISTDDINKGVYFIMIQQDNNRIVEKLIVK